MSERDRHDKIALACSCIVVALLALAVATCLLVPRACAAQDSQFANRESPVPATQWTPATRLTLARCLVGEAGWTARADHAAIAFALSRRWAALRASGSRYTFRGYVETYSAALRPTLPATPRRRWVRTLPESQPRRRAQWGAVLEFVDAWQRGEIADPCPTATHFGARSGPDLDLPRRLGWRPLACATRTRNAFYGRS